MWNKLTHLVKQRNADSEAGTNSERNQHEKDVALNASGNANATVMSHVYEQHPNLSVFHSGSAVNLSTLSPPSSPSKGSRRSMFKRSLKAKLTSTPVVQGNGTALEGTLSPASSTWTSPSPVKLMPKKLRASLQVDTFIAQSSAARLANTAPVPNSAPLPSQPHTPVVAELQQNAGPNLQEEIQPTGTGSIRSILRDRNTPGTGQSVRFFSRDAYRVISPNVSEIDIDQGIIEGVNSEGFLEKLRLVSPERGVDQSKGNSTKYHSASTSPPDNVVDMFSPQRPDISTKSRKPSPFQPRHPPRARNTSEGSSRSSHSHSDSGSFSGSSSQSLSSLTIPPPPADMSNLFDVSQDHIDIPTSVEGSLLDNAIEEVENEDAPESDPKLPNLPIDISMNTVRRSSGHISFPASASTPQSGGFASQPRKILSPEGSIFHSMSTSSHPTDGATMFHSLVGKTNELASTTMFFTPDASHIKITNGTAFFTPEAPHSTTPPASEPCVLMPASEQVTIAHTLEPSQELVVYSREELVASLREQLTLQSQLASQFEVDLAARDELVSLLSTQLHDAEAGAEKYRKEVERRQSAMRVLRRKVSELEKICRGLEEEVDRSREESFERSIMDEASEGALVILHGSIGQLKGELEKALEAEAKIRHDCDALKGEVEVLLEQKRKFEEMEKELRTVVDGKDEEIKRLNAMVEEASQVSSTAEQTIQSLRGELTERQQKINDEHERHGLVESQWIEEKAKLITRLEARTTDQDGQQASLDAMRRTLDGREQELEVLREEVEAQWANAEKADEKIKRLEGEKEGLAKSVQALHSKVEELGSQWKESEGKKVELEDELHEAWASKDDLEHERDQLVEDINFERENAEQLTQTLQERQSKLDELEQERNYTMDNVMRLEELLRTRDAECAEAQSRIIEREQEAEQLRAQMSKMKREHSRFVDEHGRHLNEIVQRENGARKEMEEAIKQKAEDDVALSSMKERLGSLMDEVTRLRRQMRDLQQESADKEVKLLQLTKARAQDKEDKEGLNIALDSKQQELELLKRKLCVRGTGGSTPAPTRVGLPDLGTRRQSVAFATPNGRPRPNSVTGIAKPSIETPLNKGSYSTTSLRTSTSTVKPTRMGPPPAPRNAPLSASTSSLARSTSSSKSQSTVLMSSGPHRRSSSVISSTANATESDKENAAPAKTVVGRRSTMVPA